MNYVSVRVQAEYERFKQGKRSQCAALFIDGMIPDPDDFHQQFNLFMKIRPNTSIMPHDEKLGNISRATAKRGIVSSVDCKTCLPATDKLVAFDRYSCLSKYHFGRIYSFPSRRDPVKGCNDICRHCGEWCNDPDAMIWKEYICLIGMYSNKIPEREHPLQVDPLNNAIPTYPYPFMCLRCYDQIYKENIENHDGYARIMGKKYEIDHIFLMNIDEYPHMKLPVVKKRRKTWNVGSIQKIDVKSLSFLHLDGYFHDNVISRGRNEQFSCWLCGDLVDFKRAYIVEGIPEQKLPIKITTDGKPKKNPFKGFYIKSCTGCMSKSETDRGVAYPFGIKYKMETVYHIND